MTLPLTPTAQRACLHALGAAAERIGFDVPPVQYSQAQALELIETVIDAYETVLQASMRPHGPDGFEDRDVPF